MVRQINDELAIAGLVTVKQLQQLPEAGFKSVLNLRSLDTYRLRDEQRYVESLGLCYAHLPIDHEVMSAELVLRVIQQLNELAKPTLVYCSNEMLAAAMVLMYIAMRQGETFPQAFKRAEKIGLFRISVQPVPTSSAR
ncbi:beta-lactamase hydrolase domain-containing protein [Stenomitos frigidus]|uniref:Phosphatase n=1 Tax=Stenomitos frigidus ULC18 TaxID=2107698 RepID=A0A2T1E0Q1_9CYAN|nr:sulfur transferase domain-containing protein [Stenomitos frigidus]PSB26310.1 hypothetical protein C7B82_20070 [Stenomitos frigidus ULC18]